MALSDDIEALRSAMRKGVQTVEYDGRRVTYRSIAEMREVLQDMEREQAGTTGPTRLIYGVSTGWR